MKADGPALAGAASAAIRTTAASGGAELPPGFDSALRALIGGRGTVEAVRREMANALFASLEPVDAIGQALRHAAEAGGISNRQLAGLLEDLQQISSEEIPTDLTERTPAPASRVPPTERKTGRARERTAPSFAEHAMAPAAPVASSVNSTEIRVGAVLRDRFQLTERVAGGRMGEVYRAVDRLKREAGYPDPSVAIKVLGPDLRNSPEALHLLQQEALKAQRLSHPGIVNVFDLDRTEGHYFITMEWLNGESLAALLDRARPRPMPLPEVRRILSGVGEALTYAHRQGMVHGDIKPGNIFLGQGGRVKLLDFGLARMPDPGHQLESDGPFAMTRAYASCEMLEGRDPLVQDDVYALACVVYRMVAGHRPFGQRTALEAEREGLRPRRPNGLGAGAWRALRAGLAYRRKARPQTVEAFVSQFLGAESGRGHRGWIAALVAGGVLALAGFMLSEYGEDLQQLTGNLPQLMGADPAVPEREAGDVIEPTAGLQSADESIDEAVQAADEFETLAPVDSDIATVRLETAGDRPALSAQDEPVELSEQPAPAEPIAVTEDATIGPRESRDELAVAPEAPPVDAATAVVAIPAAEFPARDAVAGEPAAAEPDEAEPSAADTSASAPVVAAPVAREPVPVAAPRPAAAPSVRSGFTETTYQVGEGASFVRLPIRLPRAASVPIQLRIMVIPGSARPGEDYVAPASDTVVVAPGARETVILIPLVSDALPENIEEFSVRLFSDSERIDFDVDRALVIIVDDD